ncbi:MAG: LON peptidase substrate-binding domain-containing protein [Phycisphaerales bacterium]
MVDADDIDYDQPIALFPLPAVSLLPHTLQALHIFEPRYRQMVRDALGDAGDEELLGAAPVAMATFAGESWQQDYAGAPPLRPIVCVGRIVRRQRLADGRFNIVLHGVARARILELHEPAGRRLYRMAELAPLERPLAPRPAMRRARAAMQQMLASPRIQRLEAAKQLLEWMGRSDVPMHAAVEVLGYAFIRDAETRYRLLSETDAYRRARIVRQELVELERLIAGAELQHPEEWPKGVAVN